MSDVYRSMGVLMPRNTSDQARQPGARPASISTTSDGARNAHGGGGRLQVGDLVYIPGHVMMVIGRIDDVPYVIHDTNGGSYLGADGKLHCMHLNGVSVTPLHAAACSIRRRRYIDRMTNIVRMRPTAGPAQATGGTTSTKGSP